MHRVKQLFLIPSRFNSNFSPKFNPWHDYRAYMDQVKTYISRLNPYIELDLRSAVLNWDFILNDENASAITENISRRKETEYADIQHVVNVEETFDLIIAKFNDNIDVFLSSHYIEMFKDCFIESKRKN